MRYLSIVFVVLCGNIFASDIDSTIVNSQTQYVFSFSGMNLRSEASTNANVITKLTHGTEVEVLSVAMVEEEIDHRLGRWTKVRIDGYEGFLFGGFLSIHQPPYLDHIDYDCEDKEYSMSWIEHRLRTNIVAEKNFEVINIDGHEELCREVKNTTFESGDQMKEVVRTSNKTVSLLSETLTFNDVLNYMDYYAACRTKWCADWSGFKPTFVVPIKDADGRLNRLSIRYPYLVTAEKQGDLMHLRMNINL